mmetsp:Transcript_25342/g.70892  ORF Transcript_25342/g.70892 Transcript_25342/m.70892 type:complete len:217 (-) Transcript_25342:546-1196(-)
MLTIKKSQAWGSIPPSQASLNQKPMLVLMAMRMTLVGVATFSVTRKRRVRMAKAQISMPLPESEVRMPPINPAMTSTQFFHGFGLSTFRKTWRPEFKLSINRAAANASQTLTNVILVMLDGRKGVMRPSPMKTPGMPPRVQYQMARHPTVICWYRIVKVADVIPKVWIIIPKSRAVLASTPKTSVKMGKAIDAPPSLVAPAIMLPKIITTAAYQLS